MRKYEVDRLSTNPANDKLRITFQGQPVCDIREDDLFELLTDNQVKLLQNGKFQFNRLPITKIKEKATQIYN